MDKTEAQKYLLGKTSNHISDDELRSFRACIKWACIDQSNPWKKGLSWLVFFLFVIGVPTVAHFSVKCPECNEDNQKHYDATVELSLSAVATLSYLSLISYTRKYGVRKFLFLDKVCHEDDKVKLGYIAQLQRSFKMMLIFILPVFTANTAYKIWWYISGGSEITHWGNVYVFNTVACFLEQCSWLYRTSLFFLTCVIYHDICYLQVLRLEDFAKVFLEDSDVSMVLIEHMKFRRTLRIISHRFRLFLLGALLLITASQMASVIVTTTDSDNNTVNIATGELALCSITLVSGFWLCVRSAAKITHKAQSITSLAAKWHICATIDSFNSTDIEAPMAHYQIPAPYNAHTGKGVIDSDDEDVDGDDDLDNTKLVPIFANTISYQKRQALVTYLENNRAGITVYGFMLDRTYLNTIFGLELSLILWLLSETVGFS